MNQRSRQQKKPHVFKNEIKYYGFHACLNLWKERPHDVIRAYVSEKRVKELSHFLKWCAKETKAYRILPDEEMEKVADSVHHEGLCILAKEKKAVSFHEMMQDLSKNKNPSCLLYLDGVQNPHNIGSIMRTAAHFGIRYILGHKTNLPALSPSAYRVAQGGGEHVALIAIEDFKASFQALEKAGFKMIASSSHGGKSLYDYSFSPRTVLVMGSESEGVQKKLFEYIKESLLIPGTCLVESLNVSVASALFLGEYYRQFK
ncbi:MAG TPA: TrmH family RNA methyltransferase [Parachlamydiaceae bacterium]|nr:TrmH family RNA methyltransferase [Parachlamydiaceae bacterium]